MTKAAVAIATDEDLLRAHFWGLLAALLTAPPSRDLLDRLAAIPGDDTPIGRALGVLAQAARAASPAAIAEEYSDLFIGISRGELLPYGSYYLTGFLHETPLARLRADMAELGIAVSDGIKEPEDHFAILADIMQGLIAGAFAAPLATQKVFFCAHLEKWADNFLTDLAKAESARFYRAVAALGRAFLAVEAEAFAMTD